MTIHPSGDWQPPLHRSASTDFNSHSATVSNTSQLFTIAEATKAVLAHWLLLSLWMTFCVSVAVWYLYTTPAEYSASATIILEPQRQAVGVQGSAGISYASSMLDNAQAESQMQVLKSERILSAVFKVLDLKDADELRGQTSWLKEFLTSKLGLNDPSQLGKDNGADEIAQSRAFQAFSERVGVRRIGQSYVLEVSYRARTPAQAARIANAVSAQYIKSQVDLKAATILRGGEFLQDRITDIKKQQAAALEGVRQGQIPDIQFPDSDAKAIGAALPPLSKAYPQSGLIIIFAFTVGLLTGLLVIAIRSALDHSLKNKKQVRKLLPAICLGTIPYTRRLRSLRVGIQNKDSGTLSLTQPNSQVYAGIRSIRNALPLTVSTEKHHAIGVVSCSSGNGSTTISMYLAHLIGASGDPVALLDGNLSNPMLTNFFASTSNYGLTEILLGRNDNALKPESTELSPTLRFISAGHAVDGGELNVFLGSEAMKRLLLNLKSHSEVVIDLPPLSTSSDVLAVGPFLDGVIVIIEAGRAALEEATEVLRTLRAGNIRILGVVLNKAR